MDEKSMDENTSQVLAKSVTSSFPDLTRAAQDEEIEGPEFEAKRKKPLEAQVAPFLGLYNSGQWCFANVAMQVLFMHPPVLQLLQTMNMELIELDEADKFVLTLLQEISKLVGKSMERSAESLLQDLVQSFHSALHIYYQYDSDLQHDMCEILMRLMALLSAFCGDVRTGCCPAFRKTCLSCGRKLEQKVNRAFIRIIQAKNGGSVDKILEKSLSYGDGDVGRCCDNSKIKDLLLSDAHFINLQINRVDDTGKKTVYSVKLSKILKLETESERPELGKKSFLEFELVGTSLHVGENSKGHYYYLAWSDADQSWYSISDEEVKRVTQRSLEKLACVQACHVLYRRKGNVFEERIVDDTEKAESDMDVAKRLEFTNCALGDMKSLQKNLDFIEKKLPAGFDLKMIMKKFPFEYANSLNILLRQEIVRYDRLLFTIHATLKDMKVNSNHETEEMMTCLLLDQIPPQWLAVSYPTTSSCSLYIADLLKRLEFFSEWKNSGEPMIYRLSAFFSPQSFFDIMKQNFAKAHEVAVREVSFEMKFLESECEEVSQAPAIGAYCSGLVLHGAHLNRETGVLVECLPDQTFEELPVVWITPSVRTRETEMRDRYILCNLYHKISLHVICQCTSNVPMTQIQIQSENPKLGNISMSCQLPG